MFLKCYTVVLIFILKTNQGDADLCKSSLTKGTTWYGFLKAFEKEFGFNHYVLNDPFYISSQI